MRKFNKQNLKRFAKKIYDEDEDTIYYRPLCHGYLAKMNGEMTGCILGELYEEFTGEAVGRPLTKEELGYNRLRYRTFEEDQLESEGVVHYKAKTLTYIEEHEIARELAASSTLRGTKRYNLREEILELVTVNDSVRGNSESSQIRRAKKVRNRLIEIAEEFL